MSTIDPTRLDLFSRWTHRPQTLGEFIDACAGFLKVLPSVHPLFGADLHILGCSQADSPRLAPDLSNLEPELLRSAWNSSAGPSCCDHLNHLGMPTRQSHSRLGFFTYVNNLRPHSEDNVLIYLNAASTGGSQGGGFGITLPHAAGPEFRNLDFLRRLLAVVVEYWRPEQAGITNHPLRVVPDERGLDCRVPWLTYVDEPETAEELPSDIARERLGDGLLFWLADEPPGETIDAAMVEKVRRVHRALAPKERLRCRVSRGKPDLRRPPNYVPKTVVIPGISDRGLKRS